MADKSTKTIKTRQAILDLLKRQGPQSAQALAIELSITPMAVRQHLYDLFDQKLVFQENMARETIGEGAGEASNKPTAGRPVKCWQLTPEANSLFPDRHADLAVELIASIRTTFGEGAMEQLIAGRSESQIANYRTVIKDFGSLKDKLTALAKARSDEGYMAEVLIEENGDLLFVENHCPICAAAKNCTGICTAELSVFQAALGPSVELERVEHLLSGARRCAYRVSSNSST
ncbi:metalloregulator ArsR/SmtB family transcription factor [Pelagibius sp. Alg239-R121]|uniref:helix-turn-helix transcriptional regulator n=1 Tax=Pelagibius sp. Alg239-R121 TaxID=2993448 RepID=UPI0024A6CAC0|nr:metalloregulator ArsR/SmtB family transcription factor [Pelagibius sp. Alg239-R121]